MSEIPTPSISIVIPVFNAEPYLRQCLDSVINQTFRNLEIIIVDDGSSDGCPAICDEYAMKDNRIKVIHKKNGGMTSARNDGIMAASGKYIGSTDADDWIEPDMFEKMLEKAEHYNADIVATNFWKFMPGEEKKISQMIESGYYDKTKITQDILLNGLSRVTLSVWTKLIKKKLLVDNLHYFDDKITMGEDTIRSISSMLDAESIYFMDEAFYHYRDPNYQLVKKTYVEKFLIGTTTLFEMFEKLNNDKPSVDLTGQFFYTFVSFILFEYQRVEPKSRFKIIKAICREQVFIDLARKMQDKKCSIKQKTVAFLLRNRCKVLLHVIFCMVINKTEKKAKQAKPGNNEK